MIIAEKVSQCNIKVTVKGGLTYNHGGCIYNVLKMIFNCSTNERNYFIGGSSTGHWSNSFSQEIPCSELTQLIEISNENIIKLANKEA